MSYHIILFLHTPFNGNISGWNVSSVTDMEAVFENTPFNGDIYGWDVSKVTHMEGIFLSCLIPEDHKLR
jgi:hypothetical protein